MMEIARNALKTLEEWRQSKSRKPLLIRGARQVGKTTLVRQFARQFDHYIELNLEKKADRQLFGSTDNINELLSAIYLNRKLSPDEKPTLLFIDEIQESPEAISMLRFFYEEKPELYVIAAGSLLEFALKKVPSFPVGRLSYLTLHPLNFSEFLGVVNTEAQKIYNEIPLPAFAHQQMMKLFHNYVTIGGMPEIVKSYAENTNLAALTPVYKELWQAYKDDVEKYASGNSERNVIRHVITAAPNETDRIKFEGFGNSNYRSREVGEALRTLDMARIIRLVHPCTNIEPPLTVNYKKDPGSSFSTQAC
jgi:predicted AAA+ superfamily ATPase